MPRVTPDAMPACDTLSSITNALAEAHHYYIYHMRSPEAAQQHEPRFCVLMLVQPFNINIADERPIEYELWKHDPTIPCFRMEFGQATLDRTRLTATGELLFTPQWLSGREAQEYEVTAVYYRAGHDAHEYVLSASTGVPQLFVGDETTEPSIESPGAQCRLRIEISRAIKCPSLLGHLATFKQVQCAITMPNALETLLSRDQSEKVEAIRETFVDMFNATDDRATRILDSEDEAQHWVLKPMSLEGGGNGVFGRDIPKHCREMTNQDRSKYMLMRKIESPPMGGLLMSSQRLHEGGIVSELQIFGACMWSMNRDDEVRSLMDRNAGWSLKTKADYIDEMSVIKGYGCFDSPLLVSDEQYLRLGRPA